MFVANALTIIPKTIFRIINHLANDKFGITIKYYD